MRRRSGAIHSDSVEQFLRIAQTSENRIGIFYDEKMNEKIDTLSSASDRDLPEKKPELEDGPSTIIEKVNIYEGFAFNDGSEEEREEKQELGRRGCSRQQIINVGIISSSIKDSRDFLKTNKEYKIDTDNHSQLFDLFILRKKDTLLKCWLFQRHHLQESPILQIYLKKCQIVFQLDSKHALIEVCRSQSQTLKNTVYDYLISA